MTFLVQNNYMYLSPYLYTYSYDHLVEKVNLDSTTLIVLYSTCADKNYVVQGIWNGQSKPAEKS